MRITSIRCYRQWQPFVTGTYATSAGTADGFDSLVVAVDTDEGMTGWGEMAPLGSFYDPAFSGGARAAVGIVSEALHGIDPGLHRERTELLDRALRGHEYAKSAFDMACWDVAAKALGRPLCEALGGRFGHSVDLYRSIPPDSPEAMATAACGYVTAGYRRLQVKVGGDPQEDARRLAAVREAVGETVVLYADANGGWTTGQALTFVRTAAAAEFTLEQPCATVDECAVVRCHCPHPMVLDESIDSVAALTAVATIGSVTGSRSRSPVSAGYPGRPDARHGGRAGLQVTVEDTGVPRSTPQRSCTCAVDAGARPGAHCRLQRVGDRRQRRRHSGRRGRRAGTARRPRPGCGGTRGRTR